MKRLWLIVIIVIAALIGSVLGWIWYVGPTGVESPHDGSRSLTESLTRGYHTTALLREFNDDQVEQALIVIQNDWELRPSGGFITALGQAQIRNGQLTNLSVVPSDFYDDAISIEAPMPPGLAYRISTPNLTLRDANWDVDFATTAATISRYYHNATGLTPDIIVAITTKTAEQLLEQTGPLSFEVNGHVLEVNSQTVTSTLEDYTDQNFRELGLEWDNRKNVLSAFAGALLPRIQLLSTEHPILLLRLINDLLESHDLQAWSQTERISKHLMALGASQAVESFVQGDALLVVDANVGARKTNSVIEQRFDYRIDLSTRPARATLHITYTHTGEPQPTIIDYYDTLRIYAPFGSSLKSTQELDAVTEYSRHNRSVFEGRLIVAIGKSKTVTLEYEVPLAASKLEDYQLLLEHQPGAFAAPVQITVFDGQQTATIDTTLTRDSLLSVER